MTQGEPMATLTKPFQIKVAVKRCLIRQESVQSKGWYLFEEWLLPQLYDVQFLQWSQVADLRFTVFCTLFCVILLNIKSSLFRLRIYARFIFNINVVFWRCVTLTFTWNVFIKRVFEPCFCLHDVAIKASVPGYICLKRWTLGLERLIRGEAVNI